MNIRQAVSPGQGGWFGQESLQEVPLHANTLSLTDERHGCHSVLHTLPPLMQAAIGRGYVRPRSPAEGLNAQEDESKERWRKGLVDQFTILMFCRYLQNECLIVPISCVLIKLPFYYIKSCLIIWLCGIQTMFSETDTKFLYMLYMCTCWKWPFFFFFKWPQRNACTLHMNCLKWRQPSDDHTERCKYTHLHTHLVQLPEFLVPFQRNPQCLASLYDI